MIDKLILAILIIQLPAFIYTYYTAGGFVIKKALRKQKAGAIRRRRRKR
jgi:hypothetical protein